LSQVKKFNLFKNIVLWSVAVFAVLILFPFQFLFRDSDDIHAQRFCAYGEVYVEFEHGGKIWGTTFLDNHGKPVSCNDDDVQHTASNKEII